MATIDNVENGVFPQSRLKQLLDEGMGIVCFVDYITAWRAPDDPPLYVTSTRQ